MSELIHRRESHIEYDMCFIEMGDNVGTHLPKNKLYITKLLICLLCVILVLYTFRIYKKFD